MRIWGAAEMRRRRKKTPGNRTTHLLSIFLTTHMGMSLIGKVTVFMLQFFTISTY